MMHSSSSPAVPAEADENRFWHSERNAALESAVDLRLLLRKLWHYRNRILLAGVAAGMLGVAYISTLQPTYTASAELLMGELASSTDLEDLEGAAQLDSQRIATAVEIFYSARVLSGVAENLLASGAVHMVPGEDGMLVEQFVIPATPNEIGAERQTGDSNNSGELEVENSENSFAIALVIGEIQEYLNVERIPDTSVIGVSYSSSDPGFSQYVVNLVVDEYIEEVARARSQQSTRQITWLEQRIADLREEIQETEDAVEAEKAKLTLQAGRGLETIEQILEARTAEYSDVQSEVSRLSLLSDRLNAALTNEEDILSTTEFRSASPISDLIERMRDIEDQILGLSENNPARVALESARQEVLLDIREEAQRVLVSVQKDLQAAREREELLGEVLNGLESRALEMTRAQLDLRQLEMDAEIRRVNYEDLNRQLQIATGRAELRPLGVQLLSRAELPGEADSSRQITIIALIELSGLILACGWIVFRDLFSQSFSSATQLNMATGLPVIGRLPMVRAKRNEDIICGFLSSKYPELSESVRNFCYNLLYGASRQSPGVIVFGSSAVGEGKSTVTYLAALQLQRMGRRTVFLDCDVNSSVASGMRKKELSLDTYFAILRRSRSLDEVLTFDHATNLSYLPLFSDKKSNRTYVDLLQVEGMLGLVKQLRRDFDVVVINAPPTTHSADIKCLSRVADAFLMVVRWRKTTRAELTTSIVELSAANVTPTGLIMSIVDEEKAAVYEVNCLRRLS